MKIKIKHIKSFPFRDWDNYVLSHPDSNVYHLSGWKNVIEKTYGHKTYYLAATDSNEKIVGILPLVHLKHILFGNALVSLPFVDISGILSNDENVESMLIDSALDLGRQLRVKSIELRQSKKLNFLDKGKFHSNKDECIPVTELEGHKVRMLLQLPESSDTLMKSFNSKFRNKIKKPIKSGLKCIIGSSELIEDFYKVFAVNMRDLGSPVHSKQLFENICNEFPGMVKIGVVYHDKLPISGIFVIKFKKVIFNPWASSLKCFSNLRANTLQYWCLLDYACKNGVKCFDFGRSSPNGGTYVFKEKWGACPHPLSWYHIPMGKQRFSDMNVEKPKYKTAINVWKKLPITVTKIIGPSIRGNINL
ncbi:FemAB family XrtA/PEP-CTERM system-associated protein [Desulfobacter latus]|uniref:FemAB family XrtA/PEP-CTERM system-associated protein n=1 Tax=Desulfobacter latus TaxID=2292 RepID=UPI001C499A3C|nr:FemAB family XrtA/PEP-CTERM system-associated protein [Desulfobacter latus]